MPTQRLSMRRIREVLRLRHQGLTERVIARNIGSRSNEMSAHHRVKIPLTISEMRTGGRSPKSRAAIARRIKRNAVLSSASMSSFDHAPTGTDQLTGACAASSGKMLAMAPTTARDTVSRTESGPRAHTMMITPTQASAA
jgi:hypothetical protein